MKLWNGPFKRRGSAAVRGDLRDALIIAVASNDHGTLARLLRDHRDEIGQRFPSWTRVPDDVRNDAAATERYAQALIDHDCYDLSGARR